MNSIQFFDNAHGLESCLIALHKEAFGSLSWSAQDLCELVNRPHYHVAVCSCENFFSGFILYSRLFDEAEIITLAVKPTLQRRKIGTNLMKRVLEKLSKQEVQSVFLEVAENNLAALGLYHYFGFVEINKRTNYYKGNLSALCMKKSLLI
ncbi:Mycothiol acetyltransferase [Commensalibacter sp. Nvir]|uniref:GNAT family N-acetyltransferase n=1 Tax=Commensalibacter sp. Nvir TaxID=3069817 RepID=UPI002D2E6C8D|nr:Mycothiol acetyltransferase [Commensalibacter sp. Nvir]